VPHTFYAEADGARALVGFAPMQFEGFQREVGQPAPERVLPPPADGPPDMERLIPIAKRNGFEILGPPRAAARALAHHDRERARTRREPARSRPATRITPRQEEPMTAVTITPTDNGPYQVNGPVTVIDPAGTEYDISEQTTIYLCRCGNSATKPFCDGTHQTQHFQAANRAAGVPAAI
jgi:CDGSH-type Zn-finger protein